MLSLVLAVALAQADAGVVSTSNKEATALDAPRITRLASGEYLFSKSAYDALDTEVKRLQTVESQKQQETATVSGDTPWVTVVLISVATGLVAGAVGGYLLGRTLPR